MLKTSYSSKLKTLNIRIAKIKAQILWLHSMEKQILLTATQMNYWLSYRTREYHDAFSLPFVGADNTILLYYGIRKKKTILPFINPKNSYLKKNKCRLLYFVPLIFLQHGKNPDSITYRSSGFSLCLQTNFSSTELIKPYRCDCILTLINHHHGILINSQRTNQHPQIVST